MDERRSEIRLTASECARRTGLSVRTLRIYERHGLISPPRTGKDWRVYGANELARLNEILALKALGLSLSRIADLLDGKSTDLGRTLAIQREALEGVLKRAHRGLAMIGALQDKLAGGAPLTLIDLTNLAKESSMVEPTEDAVAWRRYEQNRPRTEVPVDHSVYEDYAGCYQLKDGPYYIVTAKDGRLFTRVVGQSDIEIFPESETEFFMKALPVQVTFARDADGLVNSLTHHQNGVEIPAGRVDPQTARGAEEELLARIHDKVPFANSKAIIQRIVAEHVRGEPDYDGMAPALAALARQQSEIVLAELARAGDLIDISFKGVSQAGWDVYEVCFTNTNMEWSFFLGADGKVEGLFFRPTP
ncbi:transcriptional regulator [Devosia sp. Root685]|uniref:MerR family transcriptional regulator n=1 Tax=Devosia sp. Root685 TaxID=1736587 RepID=UPI0006F96BE3|nr:MerR family transcriptional regulator [Devosia sp. Root685]KRA99620.1 transcriptional regulator [Devosia sp. Root685]